MCPSAEPVPGRLLKTCKKRQKCPYRGAEYMYHSLNNKSVLISQGLCKCVPRAEGGVSCWIFIYLCCSVPSSNEWL